MKRIGRVIKSENGICTIEFERLDSCKSCGQCRHSSKSSTIELQGNYEVGDNVEVCTTDSQFLKATIIAYIIPLILMLSGLLIASSITNNEYIIAIAAFAGLGIGLIGLNIAERNKKFRASWEPYILGLADDKFKTLDNMSITKKNF